MQAELRKTNQSLIVKQGELTQFSKDNARLASELGTARKQISGQGDSLRKSERQLTALREQLTQANAQFSAKSKEFDLMQEQLTLAQQEVKENARRQTELEICLAETQTSLRHFKADAEAKGNRPAKPDVQAAEKSK